MPQRAGQLNGTARGVSAAGDTLRVQYDVPAGARLTGIVVSARANADAPTAAQQNGIARVVAYIGADQYLNVAPNGGQDGYKGGGRVIADAHVCAPFNGGGPTTVVLRFRAQAGCQVTVEVSRMLNNDGTQSDADASVTLQGDETAATDTAVL